MPKLNQMDELLDRKNPPALTVEVRKGIHSVPHLYGVTAEFFAGIPEMKRTVGLGVLFLWHDHWAEAHAAAHEHEGNPDSDLLHAMVHRREGDYGNSEYWLRETGHHPLFEILGPKVLPILIGEPLLSRKIVPDGKWNAKGFVAAVKARPNHSVLREVQAEEFISFYSWLVS